MEETLAEAADGVVAVVDVEHAPVPALAASAGTAAAAAEQSSVVLLPQNHPCTHDCYLECCKDWVDCDQMLKLASFRNEEEWLLTLLLVTLQSEPQHSDSMLRLLLTLEEVRSLPHKVRSEQGSAVVSGSNPSPTFPPSPHY